MLKFKKAGEFKDVIYEKSGYVARITLKRPGDDEYRRQRLWKGAGRWWRRRTILKC